MNRDKASHITTLALHTLEDALAQSQHGPVQRHNGHRLALGWLHHTGALERWQANAFWKDMADSLIYLPEPVIPGHRYQRLGAVLSVAYNKLSISPPDDDFRWQRIRRFHPDLDDNWEQAQHLIMCNRYQPGSRERIEQTFKATPLRAFNDGPDIVHPKAPGWVIRIVEDDLRLDQMIWGLPLRLRGKNDQLLKPKAVNNARFDKLGGFWQKWTGEQNRCLIPTQKFAEAIGLKGRMTEAWLSVKDEPIFAWAGIWGHSEEWGDWYSGVMTNATPELMHIHDRAPVILRPHQWNKWLTLPRQKLSQFDQPLALDLINVEETKHPWKRG